MNPSLQFTSKDTEKLVELLNTVALQAKFKDLDVKEIIRIYGLLNWAQKDLLIKIESNIIEVKSIRKLEEEKPAKKAKAKAG